MTPTVVTQQISIGTIAASEYRTVSGSYEMGYGKALNLVTCTGWGCAFEAGCTVTSSVAARRSSSVTFTAVVESSSSVVKPTGGVTAASLATGISTVISGDAGTAQTAGGVQGGIRVVDGASSIALPVDIVVGSAGLRRAPVDCAHAAAAALANGQIAERT